MEQNYWSGLNMDRQIFFSAHTHTHKKTLIKLFFVSFRVGVTPVFKNTYIRYQIKYVLYWLKSKTEYTINKRKIILLRPRFR